MGVAFVGRLVCPVNMLYKGLGYTGSLDRSTRASDVTVQISLPVRLPRWEVFYLLEWEHIAVQISYACKTMAGFINCFPLINFVLMFIELSYTRMCIFSPLWVWPLFVDWLVL